MSTVTLHSEKKKMNVPQLRFKEFSAYWKEDRFDSFCTLQRGFDLTNSNRKEGEVPVYSSSGISYYHNEFKVKAPGIVTGRKGKIGSVFYIEEDFWPHDTSLWVKDFHRNDERFVYWFLLQFKLERFEASSSVPTLNRNNVHNIKVSLPTLPEQQKIASFLSAVDEKILQLARKKELLEQYKKGVMQQLFSGKLRFKDENGKDYPDWEKKKLGDIADFYKGKGLPKSDIVVNGKYKCLHYGELFTKYKEKISNIISKTDNCDKPFLSITNDVLMPTSDVTPNGLATASCINENDVILGGDVLVIRQKVKFFEGIFFSYYVTQNREKVMKLVSGSTVYHLYGSDMKKLEIQLPSLLEQQKIATFLSSIDTKIESVNQQITQTQTFKKGLLQQMFV